MRLSIERELELEDCRCDDVGCRCPALHLQLTVTGEVTEQEVNGVPESVVHVASVEGLPHGMTFSDLSTDVQERLADALDMAAYHQQLSVAAKRDAVAEGLAFLASSLRKDLVRGDTVRASLEYAAEAVDRFAKLAREVA